MRTVLFLFLILETVAVDAKDTNFLHIEVGEQKTISIPHGASLLSTNPKSLKVFVKGNKILAVGRQPGKSEITGGGKHIKVVVYSTQVGAILVKLERWQKEVFGIQVEPSPKSVILTGEAHRLRDWLEVQELKADNGKLIESYVKISPELFPQLQQGLEKALKERSIFEAKPQVRNGHIELLSYTKNKTEVAALKHLAEEWGAMLPAGSQGVELRPMVEIEIVIAEIKKNSVENLGLQMPGTYSATIIPAGDLSSATTTFNGITPQLHALFTDGTNRVLANPKLLCRSGETAHFVAGGEIPIKLVSWKTNDVIWKKYGVILDITPLADFNQGISTKLVTEISLLDEAHTVDHIPGLLTNRIETHFDLRGSKTIALSGLIKSELGRGTTGVPLLSQIPILGELFKSKNYQDNRTELVVFVTPRVISPENPPQQKIPKGLWDDG